MKTKINIASNRAGQHKVSLQFADSKDLHLFTASEVMQLLSDETVRIPLRHCALTLLGQVQAPEPVDGASPADAVAAVG